MTTNPGDLFQEWRAADKNAHTMEQRLFKRSIAALSGDGVAPTDDERAKSRTLRTTANDLFHLAMEEMKQRAASNRRV